MATRDKKLELLALLEEKRRRDDVYRYKHFGEKLYPKQRELVKRTTDYSQVCFMAANRVGKTMTGTYICVQVARDTPNMACQRCNFCRIAKVSTL